MNVQHTEYFCPDCGKQEIYVDEDDSGDYYAGVTHYCFACHSSLPDLSGSGDVLWKHEEHGGNVEAIADYLKLRRAAGREDAETARVERELADAQAMRDARLAKVDARRAASLAVREAALERLRLAEERWEAEMAKPLAPGEPTVPMYLGTKPTDMPQRALDALREVNEAKRALGRR